MKLAIMQPYVFPYIGYFQLINSVDKFIIYDDVNFIKQGWINRNNILVGGKSHSFSIPIKDVSSFKQINETEVNSNLYPRWKEGFYKTLELNYKKAPCFKDTFALIGSVLESAKTKISDLATLSIHAVCNYLQISTAIETASAKYGNSSLKGIDRVLDICKIEKADTYVNAYGGQELYSKEVFKENGLNLFFIKSNAGEYSQFNKPFVPYLSIIDVMMFNDRDSIQTMLAKYGLL